MKHTRLCVRCIKREAVDWSGYVEQGKYRGGVPNKILAGWCAKCRHGAMGFSGHYVPGMEIVPGASPKRKGST